MTKVQYEQITERMLKRHVGDALFTVAIGNINPKLLLNECVLQGIEKDKPTLDDKKKNRKLNEAAINSFFQCLDTQIYHYSPMNGNDITNIDASIDKVNTVLNDKAYSGFKKIVVFITDGRHEDLKGNSVQTKSILTADNVTIYLTGWNKAYPTTCFANANIQESANVNTIINSVLTEIK
jgi:hypothetical protein